MLLAFLLGVPAYCLEFSVSTNGVGMSQNLDLDRSTSFEGLTVLNNGDVLHGHEARGSGNNVLQDTVRGDKFAIANTIESSGSFSSSASIAASADFGAYSQNTKGEGDAGYVGTDAISNNNEMHLATYFDGSGGNLDAHLLTGAAESGAIVNGIVNTNGIECFNDDISGILMSGDLGRSVEGIYLADDGGIGDFGLNAVNLKALWPGSTSSSTSSPYLLTGYRWNAENPNIKLYLNPANLPADGLINADNVITAIKTVANRWDDCTSKSLFDLSNSISQTDRGVATKAPDDQNVHSFMALKTSRNKPDMKTIAYAQTWYRTTRVVDTTLP
jgi:hypothetical protein